MSLTEKEHCSAVQLFNRIVFGTVKHDYVMKAKKISNFLLYFSKYRFNLLLQSYWQLYHQMQLIFFCFFLYFVHQYLDKHNVYLDKHHLNI